MPINTPVTATTQTFRKGLRLGFRGIFRGNLCIAPNEEGIVEIVQNLIDFAGEGHLTEEQLRQDVGIIVGFISVHPYLFQEL